MAADFENVGRAALGMAEVLLPQWLGGQRKGHEWLGGRKANGGPGDSWSVNLNTGAWGAFATGDKGGDLISLYATLNHLDQGAACREVARLVGMNGTEGVRLLPTTKPPEELPEPIPDNAPDIGVHPQLGVPTAVYKYGRAFWVARFDPPGKPKEIRPMVWGGRDFIAKAYPAPRPLYRLRELELHPDMPVLVVEGEKCADAAAAVLLRYVVTTWSGGAAASRKTDWEPLEGRDVLIWPDADKAGRAAAADIAQRLTGKAQRIRIIAPDDRPEGWDVADAIAEGWDAVRITTWAAAHLKEPTRKSQELVKSSPVPTRPESPPPMVEPPPDEESSLVNWNSLGLDMNQGGVPHPTLANASQILQMHPMYRNKIWLDSFRGVVYHTLRGPTPKPWTDADSRAVTAHIQQQLRLPKLHSKIIHEAILHAAECHARNSLTDWLDTLEWDGIPRLENWLADCLGVERTEYSLAVARNWPIAMIARAYKPGCKMDNMPVLEGVSGLSKTSFLEALGDPWYKSIPVAFGDKDFLQAIQGTWLVEIPDMTGFSRREHTQILATITIRTDSYRASYGRFTEEHPRVAMFAATSETDDYLQDTRGRRRYWPLRCEEIDVDALRKQREQIFAEAIIQYRQGARWWEMPGTANNEQLLRAIPDLWTDRVMDFVDEMWDTPIRPGTKRMPITSTDILTRVLEIPLGKQTDTEKRRIARIMRENGWVQDRTADRRGWKKILRRDPTDGRLKAEGEFNLVHPDDA